MRRLYYKPRHIPRLRWSGVLLLWVRRLDLILLRPVVVKKVREFLDSDGRALLDPPRPVWDLIRFQCL